MGNEVEGVSVSPNVSNGVIGGFSRGARDTPTRANLQFGGEIVLAK